MQVAADIWFNFILCGFPSLCRRLSCRSTIPTVTKSSQLSWTENRPTLSMSVRVFVSFSSSHWNWTVLREPGECNMNGIRRHRIEDSLQKLRVSSLLSLPPSLSPYLSIFFFIYFLCRIEIENETKLICSVVYRFQWIILISFILASSIRTIQITEWHRLCETDVLLHARQCRKAV